jgi:hypothetical protein
LGAGPFDGWAKFGALAHCSLRFSIFLGVVQNVIYMAACGLGIYCIVALERAYGENPFTTENAGGADGARNHQYQEEGHEEGGFAASIQGFGKNVLKKVRGNERDRNDDEI